MVTKKITMLLAAVAFLGASQMTSAAVSCAPQVLTLATKLPYSTLNAKLNLHVATLKAKLDSVKNQSTYATLLAEANATALSITKGRIMITLPDGTVVVDTSKGAANTFANYSAKKINENHNTRIAILDSQLFECGIGVETKRSTTDGVVESYVAKRLGNYLDNSGTVRISQKR